MKVTAFFVLFFLGQHSAHCQSIPATTGSYWQQQVHYNIDVTLNDTAHTLDGFIKMEYYNNSPDTLYFIWIHLWPNAFKNDHSAYTDQALENGSTAFYFSDNDQRGYINRLNFRVNNSAAKTQDHPQHQDIMKLLLPKPLAPKSHCKIETPFHVQLPYNFSRGGYNGQSFQVTQWYPKPAVYDQKGWHPIPYLNQGEFYSEFGDFEVQITLPKNYIVAATGQLADSSFTAPAAVLTPPIKTTVPAKGKTTDKTKKETINKNPLSSLTLKTLLYKQKNVHDFAWFADKTFVEKRDTLQLSSGRIISVAAYYYKANEDEWKNCIRFTKQAILTKSKWLGEYPYNTVSVVDGGNGGGMEYPTITLLESGGSEKMLDFVINHEVGHNWFYGILASNERQHPWMDEGMNTYYDNRYNLQQYGSTSPDINVRPRFIKNKMPADIGQAILKTITNAKKDQPIETPSEIFNEANYNFVGYIKTGQWMALLEKELGTAMFDSCMKAYYQRWSFKHPYPEDFKTVVQEVSGKNLDTVFSLLQRKGALEKSIKKDIRLTLLGSAKDAGKHHYISLFPAVGYNFYNKVMFGVLLHNYSLPPSRFQFIVAPLYSSKSKKFNGIGQMSYTWHPGDNGQKAVLAVAGSSFSGDTYADSTNKLNYLQFTKIVPSFKFVFANKAARSTVTKFIQWKTFLIHEQQILFERDTTMQIDIISYPWKARYINQLQFVLENNRVLYPYKGALQVEQGDGFVRTNFTGNYYFNYAKGGGLNLRLFAGKFFYTTDKTFIRQFETDPYHLNMTGPKGYEDYSYSNYFIGRNEFKGYSSQQIMIRDGGFKVRTDLLSDKIGKTDDWLAALNLTTDIPKAINPLQVLPFKLPIKAFLDIGTYAGAWQKNSSTGRFLYDAGLQLSLFNNVLNVYVPILYSKVYKNYFLSTIPDKRFIKTLSFSIDIQNISLRKMIPQIPF